MEILGEAMDFERFCWTANEELTRAVPAKLVQKKDRILFSLCSPLFDGSGRAVIRDPSGLKWWSGPIMKNVWP